VDWSSLLVKTRFLSEYVEEGPEPSRPGGLHPEPLTEPDLSLSTYPARATE
jgi:hypothetical protein